MVGRSRRRGQGARRAEARRRTRPRPARRFVVLRVTSSVPRRGWTSATALALRAGAGKDHSGLKREKHGGRFRDKRAAKMRATCMIRALNTERPDDGLAVAAASARGHGGGFGGEGSAWPLKCRHTGFSIRLRCSGADSASPCYAIVSELLFTPLSAPRNETTRSIA